uniref:MYND-type domain-containing protein n=1 Tax=Tetradesmus obliquus TaxID=3088 RepID=A0A383VUG6_TETOB|eukprot:jgi/Sobl393_1/7690/SZX68513.1
MRAALNVWRIIDCLSPPSAAAAEAPTPTAAAAAAAAAAATVLTPTAAATAVEGAAGGLIAGGSAASWASTGNASSSRTATGTAGGSSSSSSSSISGHEGPTGNSSGSRQPVKWGYLLNLPQLNPRWTAAVAECQAAFKTLDQQLLVKEEDASSISDGLLMEKQGQRCVAVLGLCRQLAAAAPLPLLCNNPSCDNLAGVSEAAAASKACAGCRCRYCCAACQTADWHRHKHACRLLAAAGESCV